MDKVLLDTDILIDGLRRFGPAVDFFANLTNEGNRVFFSAITEAELISGGDCEDIATKLRTLDLLSLFTKIPVTNKIAITAGDFRRVYKIALLDSLIAATAFHLGAGLLTRNTKDFLKVKEIKVRVPY